MHEWDLSIIQDINLLQYNVGIWLVIHKEGVNIRAICFVYIYTSNTTPTFLYKYNSSYTITNNQGVLTPSYLAGQISGYYFK